jgi:hypothetical protein
MEIPSDLTSTERWPVQGRQGFKLKEALRFGPYEAVSIERSWVRGGDVVAHAFEGNRRMQQYTFQLREGQVDQWLVSCEAYLYKSTLHAPIVDAELRNRSEVNCYLSAVDRSAESWLLALESQRERPLGGRLSREGGESFHVVGTRQLDRGLPMVETTGYRISDKAQPIGAVKVIGSGAVRLQPTIQSDRRGLFAAAAAALLLLEDLRAHLPEEMVG